MAADSVGQIGLDLIVNKNNFDKQMKGISGLAKKAGAALAAAFAVKKIIDFGKSCIELGSDLAEVQNVVDVTFPAMSKQIDKFSQSAAATYGLSETMAKKFTGTFGAMSKAFGFSESAAYEMSTTLTGLSGDVASFYNIGQDEAYTKLKSVFTGETESLKDLGVVMTQTALDQFALANGFGKTTAKMSEAEKVALRYKFVQEQLSTATGDFARTSGGWANQVRILSLQFDSLKATIGQGLINVFTPVLKTINILIGRLMTLANAFKAFTELIFGTGGSSQTTELTEAAAGLEDSAGAADSLADSASGVGSAAKKAAKEMRNLMGFDQVNKLGGENNDSADGTSGLSGAAIDFGSVAEGETVVDKLDSKIQGVINRLKELKDLFKSGLEIGFQGGEDQIASIKEHLKSIGDSVKDIFSDKKLKESFDNWLNSLAKNTGKIVGAVAKIGVSIADNLVGGIDKYLKKSKDYIKERLTSIFDASAEAWDLSGDLASALADISSVLSGENAKECTAALIGIFSDGFLGIVDLATKFGRDIVGMIAKPIIENKDKIKEAIDNTLGPISEVLSRIHQAVKDTFTKMNKVYDEHVKPMFDSLANGISDILGILLDGYNKYIVPVLDGLAKKFGTVWTEHVQPMLDKAIELFGKIASGIQEIWEKTLQPFLAWCAEHIMPILAPILEGIGNGFLDTLAVVSDVASGLIKALGGVVDFLVGIFTGDWTKAWEGIKTIFKGVWDAMEPIIKSPVNAIIGCLNRLVDGIASAVNFISRSFNSIKIDIPDWVPEIGGNSLHLDLPTWNPPHIPALAKGGYVKPNTPQLAMIGDNKTQGEIVAPEEKLVEMAKMAASGGNMEVQKLLREILDLIKAKEIVKLDEEALRKYFIKKTNSNTLARGKSELLVT